MAVHRDDDARVPDQSLPPLPPCLRRRGPRPRRRTRPSRAHPGRDRRRVRAGATFGAGKRIDRTFGHVEIYVYT